MEFEGQYLTYQEYQGLGGTLDQTPFNILEFESRRKIDVETQNRINVNNIPQEVKLCVYQMINCLENYEGNNASSREGNIVSETTDGYSISYLTVKDVNEIMKSKRVELNDIIRTYLLGVIYNDEHLLYAGIDDNK